MGLGGGGYVKKTQKGLDEFTGVQQYSTTTNGLIQENTCIKMIINDLFFFYYGNGNVCIESTYMYI